MTKNSILIPSAAIPVTKAVFVMLGNGFDEIEAIGPVDVMRRGGIEVYTVSMTENRLVKGATGNLIVADMALSDLRPEFIDWLVFPGADKTEEAVNLSTELSETVGRHWREGGNIAAICAAPALVLGPLGILKDEEATGYPFLKDDNNLRRKLIENKIYVPSWWAHVPEQTDYAELETRLSKYVFVLPIDQRYTEDDMIYIGNLIKKLS